MNEVVKQSNQAALIDSSVKKQLTYYQQCIYNDLIGSIKDKRPITRDSIVKLYLDSKYPECNKFRMRGGVFYVYSHINPSKYKTNEFTREEYEQLNETRNYALTWYKCNLGAVIVKGKLLVLPIINIE